MNLLPRIFRPSVAKASPAAEATGWALMAGWLPPSWGNTWNWWQRGYDPLPNSGSAIVHACVSAYSQTLAMCPGTHWRSTGDNGRERVRTSSLSRILRKPNGYQSISDFMLNLVGTLYDEGNAYALALRNDRFEISELHLMDPRSSWPRVASTGDVFYQLGGNEIVERLFAGTDALSAVPARDVLHVRLDTKRHPLKGESPLTSALLEVAASNAMVAQALAFAANQGRPSGVIETDLQLSADQVAELRRRWNEQTQGLNAGGTPILTSGLKWSAVTMNSRDAQLAELLQLSDQRITTAFRVPLALTSLSTGQGPQGSTESLMQFWVSTGLGFAANHVEEAFGRLFALAGWPDDYLEFDLEALLRAAFKDRVEGVAAGVKGGIFAVNDARAMFELPKAEGGDEPRVQQQDVPLSAWGKPPPAPPAPPAGPPAPPAPAAPQGEPNGDAQRAAIAAEILRRSRVARLAA